MLQIYRKKARRKQKKSRNCCTVYGLYDCYGNLRYIGQTRQKKLERRLSWFFKEIDRNTRTGKKLSPVHSWLLECRQKSEFVDIRVLDKNATWDVSEIICIERARVSGMKLLNVLRGGRDTLDDLLR